MNKFFLLGSLILMTSASNADHSAQEIAVVNPAGIYDPSANGYSHVIVATGWNKVAYIAGQGAESEDESAGFPATIKGQLEQAFTNLMTAIESIGGKPEQVVKLNTYFVDYDMSMLEPLGQEIAKRFGNHLPAQTLVPVPKLAIDGMLFEVDATVVLE